MLSRRHFSFLPMEWISGLYHPVKLFDKFLNIIGHTGEFRGNSCMFLGTCSIALNHVVDVIDGSFNFGDSLSLILRRFCNDFQVIKKFFRDFNKSGKGIVGTDCQFPAFLDILNTSGNDLLRIFGSFG